MYISPYVKTYFLALIDTCLSVCFIMHTPNSYLDILKQLWKKPEIFVQDIAQFFTHNLNAS